MTQPQMGKVRKVVMYFSRLQDEADWKDHSNRIQNTWDMRVVMEHIDNDLELKKLIKFFFLYSDNKSFEAFFREYDDYYESMLKVIEDRRNRKTLLEETVGKTKDKKEEGK